MKDNSTAHSDNNDVTAGTVDVDSRLVGDTSSQGEQEPTPNRPRRSLVSRIAKPLLKTLMWLLIVVCALIGIIYIPPVQDLLLPAVLKMVNSTEMQVSVDYFRLSFPLSVEVRGVEVVQQGDTMLTASRVNTSVAVFPLFSGRVEADRIEIEDASFNLGGQDSTLYLRSNLGNAQINGAVIGLSEQNVSIEDIDLSSGRIVMKMRTDTMPSTPSEPAYWKIHASNITLADIDFGMEMVETGDSLGVALGNLHLSEGNIDLGACTVDVDNIEISKLDGTFLSNPVYLPEEVATPPLPDETLAVAVPWRISLKHLALTDSRGAYTIVGTPQLPGFDANNISVNHLALEVDSFYNCGAEMRVPLQRLYCVERSGLEIEASGILSMDSAAISARKFEISLLDSQVKLDGALGLIPVDAFPIDMNISAAVGSNDIVTAFPELTSVAANLPKGRKLMLEADIDGALNSIDIGQIRASMRDCFDISLSGHISDIADFEKASGHIDVDGEFTDVDFVKTALFDAQLRRATHLPPLTLDGSVDMANGVIDGTLQANTQEGALALDARLLAKTEGYDVTIDANEFPVGTFLPGSGLGKVTAVVTANGHSLDIISDKAVANVHIDVEDVIYQARSIHSMSLDANVAAGVADIDVHSGNPYVDFDISARGNIIGPAYTWLLNGDIRNADLLAIGLADTVTTIKSTFRGLLTANPQGKDAKGLLNFSSIDVLSAGERIVTNDMRLSVIATDSTTRADIVNRDLSLAFSAPLAVDSIMQRLLMVSALADTALVARDINVIGLQQALPPFSLSVKAATDNILHNYLADNGTSFESISLNIENDSIISAKANLLGLISGEQQVDSIAFVARQMGGRLDYLLDVDNRPGTFDKFAHVAAQGFVGGNKIKVAIDQQNIADVTGYRLGALVELSDSIVSLSLDPLDPIIGYRQWTVSQGNHLSFDTRNFSLDADLLMQGDGSSLHIFTAPPVEGVTQNEIDALSQKYINVDIDDIHIADWLTVSPYTPPMKGDLSAQIKFGMAPGALNGTGTVNLTDFTYNKKRVGSIKLDVDVATSRAGAITANTAMSVDGNKVLTARGALNDTTLVEPFLLDVALTQFPLSMANPFTAPSMTLDGAINGRMDMTGSLLTPCLNGWLDFDSATVKVAMLGTTYRFSDAKIPVDSNVVRFNKYAIYGVNNNPLVIDGYITPRRTVDHSIDLSLTADHMQIIGNDRKRGSDVYGKAYISLDAKARGDINFINADVDLTIDEGTNVTYVIPDATSTLTTGSDADMVHFVNFADTTVVAIPDPLPTTPGAAINLSAKLNVAPGAVMAVDLSSTGTDRAQIASNGSVDFSLDPFGDARATGRLNITGGYVRYTPPMMSEKHFDFSEGSYVAFNGNIVNPILSVKAVDKVKANVTQEGRDSRLVNFDVTLSVSGTPSNMDVAFDLSTNEDVTVQNELQSMSTEQRANQAMNLLLYNIYTGPGTKGNATLAANPLYSFLESQLNNWMANNVRGVEVTFGIDQYERTVGGSSSMTTNYSYQVSKSFFDDRFKVVVGGNYSTGDDPDENLSQNLVNDISFEYLINKSGTMYVKLFRYTGYESILEGEVIQTGVGFVYRRKIRSLRNIFGGSNSASTTEQSNSKSQSSDSIKPDDDVKPQ